MERPGAGAELPKPVRCAPPDELTCFQTTDLEGGLRNLLEGPDPSWLLDHGPQGATRRPVPELLVRVGPVEPAEPAERLAGV